MNAEDRTRIAAGENDELPPAPGSSDSTTGLSEEDAVRKDRSYSPASETETHKKQTEGSPAAANDPDIDDDDVKVAPGTGGPDDVGEIEVDPADLNMPGR
ncbi:MAG: hypothetical protein K0R60_1673 [Microbacterium sp.]|jgi:hypothetical protein|nr:hypothetical protein [Microbacterium sp.]MDF2555778.1 hypothetical protein [Microbacterium sp.]